VWAQDSDTPANFLYDQSVPVSTAGWTRIIRYFTPPPNVENLVVAIGRGATVGSGRVEWDFASLTIA
jgi:hypothetical protein